MINALYEPFPESVNADGREYRIITDFREWLRFSDMMRDSELSGEEKLVCMTGWLLDAPEVITDELVYAVFGFYGAKALDRDPPDDEDEQEEETAVRPPVLDWKIDAPFVLGDFRRYYGIDLRTAEYIHWWEFRCLLTALPDDSNIQKRIAYRSADLSQIKNESERRRIARIQRRIAIPFEYDDDMIGAALGGLM